MLDPHNRQFKSLRISLLNQCNFGCIYCVKNEDSNKNISIGTEKFTMNQIADAAIKLHRTLKLEKVRLTGGEPSLYPQLATLVNTLSGAGLPKIGITTNGYFPKKKLHTYIDAGLAEINFSLDAIDPSTFFTITGKKNLALILENIVQAKRAGLSVKINAVIMKSINDHQILPLLEFGHTHGVTVRFLELMKMGHLFESMDFDNQFFPQEDILEKICSKYQLEPLERKAGATANYWTTQEGYKFGIIANESQPFCTDCDRLRLDSEGNIYGCIASETPIAIMDSLGDEGALKENLQTAMEQKQSYSFVGSGRSMIEIGG
ncbi:MAG TPA: GTP 3',8-cyclase MoaA [Cytophagaceae bacterium]|jgi:cyclic pyranopterin phosphate synthase